MTDYRALEAEHGEHRLSVNEMGIICDTCGEYIIDADDDEPVAWVGRAGSAPPEGAVGAARLARDQVAALLVLSEGAQADVLREVMRLIDCAIGERSS